CGRWAVLGGKVYHAGSGTELFAPAGEPGERLQKAEDWIPNGPVWFSPDGRLLAGLLGAPAPAGTRRAGAPPPAPAGRAAGGDPPGATVAVWELASGKVVARFPRSGLVAQVAFAPDGRTVALVDARGAHLHELPGGRRLADCPGPDVTCDLTDRGSSTQTVAF